MAQVTVFVDDAVRGTLPGVCVKDGVPTTDSMTVQDELGDRAGLGVAWLLLLLGPIGWIGLLFMLASRGGRGEVLTIRVPMSEVAYQRLRAARRLRAVSATVVIISSIMALWFAATPTDGGLTSSKVVAITAVAAVVIGVVVLLVADHRARHGTIGVDLDASRRWVTLVDVHPAFVAACQAHEQRQPQRT
jgi:hypothetical protein